MTAAMRRRTINQTLSPNLLKHFAAATFALTALLAIVASGEEWGAQAQVSAIEAKNQLATTEAEKLGTRKVATTLKIANNVGAASFGDDNGGNFGGGSGGGGGFVQPAPQLPPAIPGRPALRKPGSQLNANPLDAAKPPQPPGSEQEPAQPQPAAPPAPTAQDIANITASSARRSGGPDGGD